ncbi:MAG: hypothetical protein LBC25_01975 [Holosporales bacterium]|jgi:hypothetical protein|nr:hypothetical protein [Holosporales bacterium]
MKIQKLASMMIAGLLCGAFSAELAATTPKSVMKQDLFAKLNDSVVRRVPIAITPEESAVLLKRWNNSKRLKDGAPKADKPPLTGSAVNKIRALIGEQ